MTLEYTNTNDLFETQRDTLNETNDCVVRAFATAFEISYLEAHDFVKTKFQRRDRQGTYGTWFKMNSLEQAFGRKVTTQGTRLHPQSLPRMIWPYTVKGVTKYATYTIGRFVKEFSKGTYFITIRGHALTVVDGIVYGNVQDSFRLKARIVGCFKIEKL